MIYQIVPYQNYIWLREDRGFTRLEKFSNRHIEIGIRAYAKVFDMTGKIPYDTMVKPN